MDDIKEGRKSSFAEFLTDDVAHRNLRTNENANGVLTIQQTQRNELRKETSEKFLDFLLDNGLNAFQTKSGIIIEVDNENVGPISLELKLAFKSLNYNVEEQADLFDEESEEKAEAAAAKAKAKAKKGK
jgi:hypothetical protein